MAITTAQIHAAADQIDKEGKRPTLAGVRTVLGGGSFSTIQEAMKTWARKADDEEATAEPVPAEVSEAGEKAIADLWQLAERHAAAAFDDEREAHRAAMTQAAAELADAVAAADEQATKAGDTYEKLQNTWDENAKLESDNDALKEAYREEKALRVAAEIVAKEREKAIKTLEQLLKQRKPKGKAPAAKKPAEVPADK